MPERQIQASQTNLTPFATGTQDGFDAVLNAVRGEIGRRREMQAQAAERAHEMNIKIIDHELSLGKIDFKKSLQHGMNLEKDAAQIRNKIEADIYRLEHGMPQEDARQTRLGRIRAEDPFNLRDRALDRETELNDSMREQYSLAIDMGLTRVVPRARVGFDNDGNMIEAVTFDGENFVEPSDAFRYMGRAQRAAEFLNHAQENMNNIRDNSEPIYRETVGSDGQTINEIAGRRLGVVEIKELYSRSREGDLSWLDQFQEGELLLNLKSDPVADRQSEEIRSRMTGSLTQFINMFTADGTTVDTRTKATWLNPFPDREPIPGIRSTMSVNEVISNLRTRYHDNDKLKRNYTSAELHAIHDKMKAIEYVIENSGQLNLPYRDFNRLYVNVNWNGVNIDDFFITEPIEIENEDFLYLAPVERNTQESKNIFIQPGTLPHN